MNNKYLFFLVFISQVFVLSAQSGKQKKADRLYDDFAYVKAIEVYEDLLEKDYNTTYNQKRLADSYLQLRNPEKAVAYYEKVVQQPDVSPEYYFKYAQALRGVRKYDESREWLSRYLEEGKNPGNIERYLSQDEINTYSGYESFRVRPTEMNSKFSDFGAYEKDGVIYFTSARAEGSNRDKIYDWNGEPFLDIYQISPGSPIATPIEGDVNTVRHEGPLSFSPDGKKMYFTRNNYINNKNGEEDEEGVNHLKIYRATLEGNSWENIEELPFNNNTYSVGHPSLSPDGSTLYYASDAPGGYGGTDIYKVSISNGSFGTPENLGEEVNTPGNEVFPFVDHNNKFYFSSDGHRGYGLLDVFVLSSNGDVQNLGEPVNSNYDDFAFFINPETSEGYISSNRDGGKGSDDIYVTTMLSPLLLKGTITDSINGDPVANATFRLLDENEEQIAFLQTDSFGNYSVEIHRDRNFTTEANHIKYDTKSGSVSSMNSDDKTEIVYDIELSPVNDVEYLAEINKIYFDFDRHEIREDAAQELDKLVDLMLNDYPDLVIEIGSHTDRRGSEEYNRQLAERRAQATFDYLTSNGVAENRIVTFQGYGEERPETDCSRCDEEEHQLNRRSVFKVVKME